MEFIPLPESTAFLYLYFKGKYGYSVPDVCPAVHADQRQLVFKLLGRL